MLDLTGKKAIVTGSSGAIGGAIARILHKQGAELVISGTKMDALETLRNELNDRCHVIPCNLNDLESIESLVQQADERMKQIDILVNNAGVTRDGLMMRMKDDDWQKVLNVNLGATFRLSRAVLRGMARRRWGRIINIASVVGITGNPGQANYAASKAGMIGMAKSLAAEVANRGVTVNCIAPGFISSPMTDALNDTQKQTIMNKIPAGRIGSPEEISYSALFLASNESSYVTGQTVHINGGMVMV